MPGEHAEHTTQREADHHRWADDGGFVPDLEVPLAVAGTRSPWRAIGVAAALGFAIGWLTGPRRPVT